MAKKALLDVLEQTIGKYVVGLDAESLNLAFWSGEIELQNLQLDVEAVNQLLDRHACRSPSLGLPVRVRSGRIVKFQLDVPWTKLMSRPVVVRLQSLEVSLEPHDKMQMLEHDLYNQQESETARIKRKQDERTRALQLRDEFRQSSNALRSVLAKMGDKNVDDDDQDGSSPLKKIPKKKLSFRGRLVRRIMENIQVDISDIHIALQGEAGSVGVVLKSLQLATTDQDGKPTFVDRTSDEGISQEFLHRALQISGLGIYVNPQVTTGNAALSKDEEPATVPAREEDRTYVLEPLSLQAKLRQSDNPKDECLDHAKYTFVSELPTLAIQMSKPQVDVARLILGQVRPTANGGMLRPLFPEYRPLQRISSETARDWWRYAFRCIGRLSGRRSWGEYFRAVCKRKDYITLYKRNVYHKKNKNKEKSASWLDPLTSEELERLQELERDRSISVEGIMIWRSIADAQFQHEKEQAQKAAAEAAAAKSQKKGGFLSSLFGGNKSEKQQEQQDSTVSEDEDEESNPLSLSVEDMNELEQAAMVAVSDDVNHNKGSSDAKLCDAKFTLGRLTINLTSGDLKELAALQIDTVSTSFDAKADGSFQFDFLMTSLEIHDKVTPNSLFPNVVKLQQHAHDSSSGVVGVKEEEQGTRALWVRLNKTATGDKTVKVALQTFQAFASPLLLEGLKRFLAVSTPPSSSSTTRILLENDNQPDKLSPPPPTPVLHAAESFIASRVARLSLARKQESKRSNKNKSALTVDLDLQAPILVIPQNCIDTTANVLVLDMGHLRFNWFKGREEENPKQQGSVNLTGLSFLVGKAGDWRGLVQKHETAGAITVGEAVLEPVSVSVDIVKEAKNDSSASASPAGSLVDIQAKLSNVNVNWNPQVVRMVVLELKKFLGRLRSEKSAAKRESSSGEDKIAIKKEKKDPSGASIQFVAELDGLEVRMSSAHDGLPLFALAVSGVKVTRNSSKAIGSETVIVLGDVNLSTADTGTRNPKFKTILGLAPGVTESLLTVKLYGGQRILDEFPGKNAENVKTYADIQLSPMRIVYVNAQILTLVEYIMGGIIKAIRAPPSEAFLARLMALPVSRRVFRVRATDLEILLPLAAPGASEFSVGSDSLLVDITATTHRSVSVEVGLSGIELRDPVNKTLNSVPFQVGFEMDRPPIDVGSKHDQAMRLSLEIPNAGFVMPQNAYAALLSFLRGNIAQKDLFLRCPSSHAAADNVPLAHDLAPWAHAGSVRLVRQRRMYLGVEIGSLSLELATDQGESIALLSAAGASVRLETLPDEGRSVKSFKLRELNCDDLRTQAVTRQYHSLIYQQNGKDLPQQKQRDVLSLVFESKQDLTSRSLDVAIGSSNVVFVPDAVSAILDYLVMKPNADSSTDVGADPDPVESALPAEAATSRSETLTELTAAADTPKPLSSTATISTDSSVARSDSAAAEDSGPLSSTTISLRTLNCCIILVDLGSDALLQPGVVTETTQVASVAETIVFGGRFEVAVALVSDPSTGDLQSFTAQVLGAELESYCAFGRGLESALQILEPTEISLNANMKRTSPQTKSLNIKATVLDPIDVTLSMRNVALVNAILASILNISKRKDCRADSEEVVVLDESEAARMEKLASSESDDADLSEQSDPAPELQSTSSPGTLADEGIVAPTADTTFDVTVPSFVLMVVNDFQGLDQALFRLTAQNSVAKGKMQKVIREGADPCTLFDFYVDVSVLADFFGPTTNSWEPLFLEPWELSAKGIREPNQSFRSAGPSTMIGVELSPCYVSFSEQFLMGVTSAGNMWSVYSRTTKAATVDAPESEQLCNSLAASAARKFVVALPYAIENRTGAIAEFEVSGERSGKRFCENGSVEYFRFAPPRGKGSAGKREYGQGTSFEKSVTVTIGGTSISIDNIDSLPGSPRRAYMLENDEILMIDVLRREGKTIIVHLSSGLETKNDSRVRVKMALVGNDGSVPLDECAGCEDFKPSVLTTAAGKASKCLVAVPMHLARDFWTEWQEGGVARLQLGVSPQVRGLPEGCSLDGTIGITVEEKAFRSSGGPLKHQEEVVCRPLVTAEASSDDRMSGCGPFMIQASISIELVQGRFPSITVSLHPRAKLENVLPVPISVRFPTSRHVVGDHSTDADSDTYELKSRDSVEIFCPDASIAVTAKCSTPVARGTNTGWTEGGSIELPLSAHSRLPEPLRCMFPFDHRGAKETGKPPMGMEFFISQGSPNLPDSPLGGVESDNTDGQPVALPQGKVSDSASERDVHTFFVTVCSFAVDHTRKVLFELETSASTPSLRGSMRPGSSGRRSLSKPSRPLGAYETSPHRDGRITLLPGVLKPIQLMIEGDETTRRSSSFCVEDISICDGGVGATPINWEKSSKPSGFFAYRKIVSSQQSEIHVIPEYVIFNGSESQEVRIQQSSGREFTVSPGAIAPLPTPSPESAVISVECVSIGGKTPPLQVDALGLQVAIVRSEEGVPLGSLAMQTVVGGQDSRLVVKLGDVKFSQSDPRKKRGLMSPEHESSLRFKIQWSLLQIAMYVSRPRAVLAETADPSLPETRADTQEKGAVALTAPHQSHSDPSFVSGPICTLRVDKIALDWQQVASPPDGSDSPETSQLSFNIHHLQFQDDTPGSQFPMVLQSAADASFLDLCILFKGPQNAEVVGVDLFDLKIVHRDGVMGRIVVNTSEDFMWKLLDLANCLREAATENASVDMEVAWDDELNGYKATIRENKSSDKVKYTPPDTNHLLNVKKARVSPFALVVSFKRNPQASRYSRYRGIFGAGLMNYFTKRLKFKIDQAELAFAEFEIEKIKGPPNRLGELLRTAYASDIMYKFMAVMSATSFQDWKTISNRKEEGDGYKAGDIARSAGNLSGRAASLLLKSTGGGLGRIVSASTGAIGDGIEKATDAVGVKPVGSSANYVVSGVGEGVARTLTGAGRGSGKVVKGSLQAVGHVVGGVSGGAVMIGKGITKGITKGDGKAVASGLKKGVTSLGTGVGRGVESFVAGGVEGVSAVKNELLGKKRADKGEDL